MQGKEDLGLRNLIIEGVDGYDLTQVKSDTKSKHDILVGEHQLSFSDDLDDMQEHIKINGQDVMFT
jgi:hypothetical protein